MSVIMFTLAFSTSKMTLAAGDNADEQTAVEQNQTDEFGIYSKRMPHRVERQLRSVESAQQIGSAKLVVYTGVSSNVAVASEQPLIEIPCVPDNASYLYVCMAPKVTGVKVKGSWKIDNGDTWKTGPERSLVLGKWTFLYFKPGSIAPGLHNVNIKVAVVGGNESDGGQVSFNFCVYAH